MKATAKRTCTITLEMSEEEATILCALLGGVSSALSNKPAEALVDNLFAALDAQLPNREGSFSDFFTGSVAVRP